MKQATPLEQFDAAVELYKGLEKMGLCILKTRTEILAQRIKLLQEAENDRKECP